MFDFEHNSAEKWIIVSQICIALYGMKHGEAVCQHHTIYAFFPQTGF